MEFSITLLVCMLAIQIFLNHKFKVQWLHSTITSDFNQYQYFIRKVCSEPVQLQGASMIHSITSSPSPHSNFLRLLQLLLLQLCQKSHFNVVKFVVKLTILHRKMIPRGQLLLWKHLEIKAHKPAFFRRISPIQIVQFGSVPWTEINHSCIQRDLNLIYFSMLSRAKYTQKV